MTAAKLNAIQINPMIVITKNLRFYSYASTLINLMLGRRCSSNDESSPSLHTIVRDIFTYDNRLLGLK